MTVADPTLVDSGGNTTSTGTVSKTTAALAVNDVIVMAISTDYYAAGNMNSPATVSGCTSWTPRAADSGGGEAPHIKLYECTVATAGTKTLAATSSNTDVSIAVMYAALRGGAAHQVSASAQTTSSSTSKTAPSVTPPTSGLLLNFWCGFINDVLSPPPSPSVQRYTGAAGSAFLMTTEPGASTSGTGTRTATSGTSSSWAAASVVYSSTATGPTTVTASDSATRSEAATTRAGTSAADARLGADTAVTGSTFAAADSATYAEGVAAGQLTEGPDTGQGAESVSSSGTLTVSDPRLGADSAGTRGSFTTTDSGTRTEASRIGIPAPDSGTRTELVTSRGTFTAADPRTGADAATVETLYGDLVISIWAVDPSTGRLKALPDFTKFTMSPERNGPGSITLEYPRDGLNFHVLRDTITADRDLEIEIWNFGNSTAALRGYLQESSGDDIAEDQSGWTFAGGFLELRMAEAIVWPQPKVGEDSLGENVTVPLGSVTEAQWDRLLSLGYTGTAGDSEEQLTGVPQKVLDAVKANAASIPVLADPKRELQFNAVTAGALVNFLLSQARARGALTDIAVSFTDSKDSKGVTWPTVITAKYSPGASYDSILNSLASQGRVEWSLTWNGTQRILNCYVPAGRGVDRTIGLRPVVLRAGRNLAEAPRKWSVRSSATAMLGIGAEGFYADTFSLDAQTRRGRRIEDSTSSQNLASSDAVLSYAQRRLSTKKDGTLEVTHGLALLPGEPRPLIAFDVGDWVYSQTSTTLDRYRVVQWTLSVDAGQQASATVTLNDAFLDAVSRQQKELDALTSGETVAGTSVDSNKTDTGVPSAPAGLVVGSGAFFDGQDAYALVTAGWAAVTTNTDGSAAADIDGYRVEWARYSAPSTWIPAGTAPGNTTQLSFTTATNLPILVRVQCYDRTGNKSAWTTLTAPHTTDDDTTPPGVPSTPTGANYLGMAAFTWDGKTVDGAAMAAAWADFSHCELHMSTTSGFTPATTTQIDTVFGAGTYTYSKTPAGTALVYGTAYYARLVSVDLRGNKSAPSAQASATPGKLVNIDLGPDAVDRANIRNAAIGNLQVDVAAINAAQIASCSIGSLTAGTLAVSMIVATGSISTQVLPGVGRVVTDSSGIRLFAPDGNTVNVQFKTQDGSAMIAGEYRTTNSSGRRMVFNSGGTNPDEIRFYPSSTNQYAQMRTLTSVATGYENTAGIVMKGYSPRADNQGGEVSAFGSYASIGWASEIDGGAVTARIAASQAENYYGGRRHRFASTSGVTDDQVGHFCVGLTNPATNTYWPNSLIKFDQQESNGSGNGRIVAWWTNIGLQFDTNRLSVISASTGLNNFQALDIRYNSLTAGSARAMKQNIVDLPFDPVQAVMDAPVSQWEYRFAPDLDAGVVHFGPMADDLPEQLQKWDDEGRLSVDLSNNVGVLWAAVARLAQRVNELGGDGA